MECRFKSWVSSLSEQELRYLTTIISPVMAVVVTDPVPIHRTSCQFIIHLIGEVVDMQSLGENYAEIYQNAEKVINAKIQSKEPNFMLGETDSLTVNSLIISSVLLQGLRSITLLCTMRLVRFYAEKHPEIKTRIKYQNIETLLYDGAGDNSLDIIVNNPKWWCA